MERKGKGRVEDRKKEKRLRGQIWNEVKMKRSRIVNGPVQEMGLNLIHPSLPS